jgi:hypothetical protein
MSEAPGHYVMGYSERERRRLGLQADLQNPATEALLSRAGLKRGMRVMDHPSTYRYRAILNLRLPRVARDKHR